MSSTQGDGAKEEEEIQKKEEVMPEIPRLLMRGKRSAMDRWRSASVSLDGLLDYDEEVNPTYGPDKGMVAWTVDSPILRCPATPNSPLLVQDRDEPTLELSLFAEAFQEMLARDFGNQILKALYTERQGPEPSHSRTKLVE